MNVSPVLIWFLAGLALVLLEFAVPGVILIFFGLGAWVTALTTVLGLTTGLTSQLLVFGVSSVILLVVLRRWFRNRLFGHTSGDQDPSKNLDTPTGDKVMVTVALVPGSDIGRVEYKGAEWHARSEEPIAAGQPAVIVETDGITLVVKPV